MPTAYWHQVIDEWAGAGTSELPPVSALRLAITGGEMMRAKNLSLWRVQLRALFESPTVAGLAAHVAQAVNEGTAAATLTSDLAALSDEALDALILAAAKP